MEKRDQLLWKCWTLMRSLPSDSNVLYVTSNVQQWRDVQVWVLTQPNTTRRVGTNSITYVPRNTDLHLLALTQSDPLMGIRGINLNAVFFDPVVHPQLSSKIWLAIYHHLKIGYEHNMYGAIFEELYNDETR